MFAYTQWLGLRKTALRYKWGQVGSGKNLMGSHHALRKVGVTLPVRSVGEKIPYSASPHGRREPVTRKQSQSGRIFTASLGPENGQP